MIYLRIPLCRFLEIRFCSDGQPCIFSIVDYAVLGSDWIQKILPHSTTVPFWQHTKMGNVTCDQAGFIPFPRTCAYFVNCAPIVPGRLFRLIYKCTDDRVYSIKYEACVRPSDSERVECGGSGGSKGVLADRSGNGDVEHEVEEDQVKFGLHEQYNGYYSQI